jgi:hypothetical protein
MQGMPMTVAAAVQRVEGRGEMPQRNIDTSYWSDPKVTALPVAARYVFLYLVTNPHGHVLGIYHLPLETAARETGGGVKEIAAALDALTECDLIRYDDGTNEVWVVSMLKWQANNPSLYMAALNLLATIHSTALKTQFCDYYREHPLWSKLDKLDGWRREAVESLRAACGQGARTGCTDRVSPQPAGQAPGTGTGTGTGTGSGSRSVELALAPSVRLASHGGDGASRFETFWSGGLPKANRKRAERVWRRLKTEERIAAVSRLAGFIADCKASNRHLPHPTTYLEDRRWTDELSSPAPAARTGPDPTLLKLRQQREEYEREQAELTNRGGGE